MERQRVTQSIWVSVSHKSRCNPALVLRLSLVGLVYSGTVDLRLPPALFPSFATFSFSLSMLMSCMSLHFYLSVSFVSYSASAFTEEELRLRCSDGEVRVHECVSAHVGLWSIRCGGVDFGPW